MVNLNDPEYDLRKGKLSLTTIVGNSRTSTVREYEHCNFVLSGDYLVVLSKQYEGDKVTVKHEVFPLSAITAYIRYK